MRCDIAVRYSVLQRVAVCCSVIAVMQRRKGRRKWEGERTRKWERVRERESERERERERETDRSAFNCFRFSEFRTKKKTKKDSSPRTIITTSHNLRGQRLVSWPRGAIAKGVPSSRYFVWTPSTASLGYPLSVFNKNSTLTHCRLATISRLLRMIGLFCKRALLKRRYSSKENYNLKEPTNRSHPISVFNTTSTRKGVPVQTECMHSVRVARGLRFVGSFKLHVSFAEYRLFNRALLQKRPVILRSLLKRSHPISRPSSSSACELGVHARYRDIRRWAR